MDRFSFLVLLSLILPAACHKPEDYGFSNNGNGEYSKEMKTKDGTLYTLKMTIFSDRHAEFHSDNDVDLHWTDDIPKNGWELPGDVEMAGTFGSFGQTVAGRPPLRSPSMAFKMKQNQGMHQLPGLNGAQNTLDLMKNGRINLERFGAGDYNHVVQNSQLKNYGQYYMIMWKREDVNGKCTQSIKIQGHPEKATAVIKDEFLTTCDEKVTDLMYYKGDEVLVGGIDQNKLVIYGHKDIPEQLIVVMGEECVIYTYQYDGGRPNNKATFLGVGSECQNVKTLIKNIQDEFAKKPQMRKDDLKERQQELNNLVKDLIKGSEATTSVGRIDQEEPDPDDPPSSSNSNTDPPSSSNSNTDPPSSSNSNTDPPSSSITKTAPVPTVAPNKKKHWLRRWWIAIKNISRKMTGRPTRDE